jgi:hypothetical protein
MRQRAKNQVIIIVATATGTLRQEEATGAQGQARAGLQGGTGATIMM